TCPERGRRRPAPGRGARLPGGSPRAGRCYARPRMGDRTDPGAGILAGVRQRFEESTDFTVGLEEEFQILDPTTLELTGRFEAMMAAADGPLRERLAGELIASEIEYRTVRHTSFVDAARELVEGRLATLALADRLGLALGVS